MKTILCYGDSNTYGYNPENALRYPKNQRWTGILGSLLGPGYDILEEGCNGRTTAIDDLEEDWVNGLTYLKTCLKTHMPTDIFLLMLGTNDLKRHFDVSARKIALNAGILIDTARDFSLSVQEYIPEIILIAPPILGRQIRTSPFYPDFDESSVTRSCLLAAEFKSVAEEKGCLFFDAGTMAKVSPLDQIHLSREAHKALAEGLYGFLKCNHL